MKASAFDYARATSVVNALELLAAHGDRAKVLSGGQSLLPAMNLRLVSPDIVVDICGIAELRGVAVRDGVLLIGALTRHVDLLRSPEVAVHAPLLREAVAHIAHPAIRNRGTIGGSLAHADPASELPACVVTLDATIVVRGPSGERRIAAVDFFRGIYETELLPQELLVAIELPVAAEGSTFFFQEFARRHGDYAIVGLAACANIEDGMFSDIRLGFFAVGDRPRLVAAARKLVKRPVTRATVDDAATALVSELDPPEDQQASPAMRLHLACVLLRRCIATLLSRPELGIGAAA
jgi:aerobic carbon-monoxide dehydrogenase medium subunit